MLDRQLRKTAILLLGSCCVLLPSLVVETSRAIAQTNSNPVVPQGDPAPALPQGSTNATQNLDQLNQYLRQGRQLIEAGNYLGALEAYRQAALIDGTNPRIFAGMGYLYASQGFYREAVTSYQNAVTLDRRNPDFFYALGVSQANLQDYQSAIASFRQALTINRNLSEAYLGMAACYVRQGNLPLALSTYRQLLAINPRHDQALESVGQILLQQKQYPQALQSLEAAARFAPRRASIQVSLGQIYLAQGNVSAAKTALLTAGQTEQNNPTIQVQVAQSLQEIGDREQALSFYRRAIALQPNLAVAYAGMADLYLLQQDYTASARAYQQVVQLLPDNAQAFFNLGLALQGGANQSEAVQAFTKARDLFQKQGNARGVAKSDAAIQGAKSAPPPQAKTNAK